MWSLRVITSRVAHHAHDGIGSPRDGHVGSTESLRLAAQPIPVFLSAGDGGVAREPRDGHLGLRFLGRRPEIFHRAVLTAPMVDIHLSRPMKPSIRLLSRFMTRLGFAHVGVPGTGDDGGGLWRFEGNPLTSDRDRFERNSQFVRKEPRLAIGGVTFGWAKAAFDSIEKLGAPGEAESLPVPVLMVSPQLDTVVSLEAQRRFCRRCNRCRQVLVDGALHEILMESDSHRRIFWGAFDEDTATRP